MKNKTKAKNFNRIILFIILFLKSVMPFWVPCSGELQTQKLKSHLNGPSFKARSGSVYSHICYNYCQGFLPCYFIPFRSIHLHFSKASPQFFLPKGRLGMSDVSPLSGVSGLSFDSTLLSPLLFFCLVLLPFLSYLFLPAGPFF